MVPFVKICNSVRVSVVDVVSVPANMSAKPSAIRKSSVRG
jgi:hypothetical protein